jgi:Flp pilus assembly protein TadD
MDDVRFQNAFDLISKGEDEKALEEIRLFLQNNPEVWNAWFMLGWALRKMGRFEDAKQAFLEAIKFGGDKNSDTLNELALCLIQLEEFSLAKKYLLDAFALSPESTKIISNLGYLALAEGNKQEARNYFAAVLEYDPNDKIAATELLKLEKED